ncbi:hypothetical protein SF06_16670 [Pseudomonas flexibilis]|uniref:hypothetical protein n=1 Tax=Pseudomonas flexibilis TaxID=706570 RepID=UPI0005733B67|nr:hypothetical protein [Pseudomonas flexibilis]KHL69594.1 hypothetical protein SF06_16670 [Pseudomonas flexibilis]
MSILLPLSMEGDGVLLEELPNAGAEEFVVSTEQGSWNHCYHLIAVAMDVQTLGQPRSASNWTVAPKNPTIQPPIG